MSARGLGTKYQGSKWIRREKRLAIYLRDGLACVYCGASIDDGARLTLDHLTPWIAGGTNHESNLVTACGRCNASRGSRDLLEFATAVTGYLDRGLTAEAITEHIAECTTRALDIKAAKALIAARGSWAETLRAPAN